MVIYCTNKSNVTFVLFANFDPLFDADPPRYHIFINMYDILMGINYTNLLNNNEIYSFTMQNNEILGAVTT